MNLYHGTSLSSANQIATAVSVVYGGGELGLGFYTTEQIAMAVAHAKGRYGLQNGKVVKLEVKDSDFSTLNVIHLRLLNVCAIWTRLRLSLGTRTHQFGVDVVSGAICVAPNITQHKFESKTSENLLNDPVKTMKSIL